ncbi:MAG: hypothetical protein U1E56_01615 [Bauldia sp.]
MRFRGGFRHLLLALAAFAPAFADAQTLTLPTSGFISGRAAVEKDIADGNAIFAARVRGVYVGAPLPIAIPQFAYLTRDGAKTLVVVVQAEVANGTVLIGVRDTRGKDAVATGNEIELLGIDSPIPMN